MAFRADFQPTEGAYVHRFRVLPGDIDSLGHANNVVWVRWVNEAAMAHSAVVGFAHAGLLQLSVLWLVRRHDIEYLLPALEGEELEAITWVHTLGGASSLRRTLIAREGKTLARAETTWVMVDAHSHKARRIPPEILAAYGF
ncbi:MAG: Thioesterase superfamily [Myxococcaceae bacterium]|nr:Thioesterase superfamily [Myxococcaceae bacterium]